MKFTIPLVLATFCLALGASAFPASAPKDVTRPTPVDRNGEYNGLIADILKSVHQEKPKPKPKPSNAAASTPAMGPNTVTNGGSTNDDCNAANGFCGEGNGNV